MFTGALYLRDAGLASFDAEVVAVEGREVALGRTAFYAIGGGQPHDTGTLSWDGGEAQVVSVAKRGGVIWHTVAEGSSRHRWGPMCGASSTGTGATPSCAPTPPSTCCAASSGTSGPPGHRRQHGTVGRPHGLRVRPVARGFAARVEELVNAELAADRPIEVSFLPRREALADADLIRTKVSLIPEEVAEIRVVDIVGLDKQADGGTHVRSTGEVGRIQVVKTESKGKGNKRIRIEVLP